MNDAIYAYNTSTHMHIQHGADWADVGWIDPLLVLSNLGSCKRKSEG